MAKEVVMPKLGLTMTEGTIENWLKAEGDAVKEGEVLFSVSTDKLTNDVEAMTSGKLLKILVPAGETVACLTPVAVIGAEGESYTASAPAAAPAKAEEKPAEGGGVLVIGGGPGGYVAAIRAAQLGAKVTLAERAQIGGTCLNRGCMPTKALLHSSEVYELATKSESIGIIGRDVAVDWARVQQNRQSVSDKLTGGVRALMRANKVTVLEGEASFTGVGSGEYTLLEESAPEGYVKSEQSYELSVRGSGVTMDGEAYVPVTFVNRRAAQLNREDHFTFLVGYDGGSFGPERNMTRAEVTTMFARLLTEQIEADKTYASSFNDVPVSHWAANYIGYMEQFGIVTGYADGSFRPDSPVTRAEFAAIASRFEKLTEGAKSFADVPATYWAASYINFAATRGWVNGYADGTFRPENPITRAEVAAVTCRLLERTADQDYIRSHPDELRTFHDMAEGHWAYWYVMEAANGHDYTRAGSGETWLRLHP